MSIFIEWKLKYDLTPIPPIAIGAIVELSTREGNKTRDVIE